MASPGRMPGIACTNLVSLNGNLDVSSNVFAVLITGDTGDSVRMTPLFGDIGTGGEAAVGNVSDPVVLSSTTALIIVRGKDV